MGGHLSPYRASDRPLAEGRIVEVEAREKPTDDDARVRQRVPTRLRVILPPLNGRGLDTHGLTRFPRL